MLRLKLTLRGGAEGVGGVEGSIFPLLTKASQHETYTSNLNGNHDSATTFANSMQCYQH